LPRVRLSCRRRVARPSALCLATGHLHAPQPGGLSRQPEHRLLGQDPGRRDLDSGPPGTRPPDIVGDHRSHGVHRHADR
jgi:hypothetical protein